MKIALIPGHTAETQGASHGKITEYGLSSAVIGDLIYRLSKTEHIPVLIGSGKNSWQAEQVNTEDADFGLELHFNSHAGEEMHGTECLHSGSLNGINLAYSINSSLVSMLKTKDRGCHIGYYQLNPKKPLITIIKNTACPFVVIEPLFLSNPADRQKIDIQLISIAIFEGILEYIG